MRNNYSTDPHRLLSPDRRRRDRYEPKKESEEPVPVSPFVKRKASVPSGKVTKKRADVKVRQPEQKDIQYFGPDFFYEEVIKEGDRRDVALSEAGKLKLKRLIKYKLDRNTLFPDQLNIDELLSVAMASGVAEEDSHFEEDEELPKSIASRRAASAKAKSRANAKDRRILEKNLKMYDTLAVEEAKKIQEGLEQDYDRYHEIFLKTEKALKEFIESYNSTDSEKDFISGLFKMQIVDSSLTENVSEVVALVRKIKNESLDPETSKLFITRLEEEFANLAPALISNDAYWNIVSKEAERVESSPSMKKIVEAERNMIDRNKALDTSISGSKGSEQTKKPWWKILERRSRKRRQQERDEL